MVVAPSIFRRALAKALDYLCLIAVFTTACTFLPIQLTLLKLLSFVFLVSFFWIPFEILFIKAFRTTPGKFVMGIRTYKDLSFKEAARFAFNGAIKSFTLFIPLFNIFAAWILIRNEPLIPTYLISQRSHFIKIIFGSLFMAAAFFGTYKVADIDQTPGFLKEHIGHAAEGGLSWDSFAIQNSLGKVSLPKAPDERTVVLKLPSKKDPPIDLHQLFVTDEANGIEYTISTVEIPHNLMSWGPKMILKGSLEVVELNSDGLKLLDKKSIREANIPSLYYTMQGTSGEKMGRLILIGNQLVKLEVSYPIEKKADVHKELSEFLDSFRG